MIGKIAAIMAAGTISGLITSVAPGPAPDVAMHAALRGSFSAPHDETIVVDRVHKTDRLPIHRANSSQNGLSLPKTVPLGCDTTFSPIADPAVAHIFRRCAA